MPGARGIAGGGQGARRPAERMPDSYESASCGEEITIAFARNQINALPEQWRGPVRVHPYVPSLAYRIAMVARGDIAGTFIRPNSHDWDLAAADLILSESGGAILTSKALPLVYGGPTRSHGALVAASGNLLREMLSVVADQPLS